MGSLSSSTAPGSKGHVSNLLSSPASGEGLSADGLLAGFQRFQFIEFPSEWGEDIDEPDVRQFGVSNLLSSPASGEL